jgi:hypothetical protein
MTKERPASTDMADVTKVDDHAQAHDAKPTAGPSEDDRFGPGKIARDLHARVIKVDVVGARTRITIASGTAQGVHVAMEGYVIDKNGATHQFQVESSSAGVSQATIDGPVEELEGGGGGVVINPSAMPAAKGAKQDMHGRILMNTIEGGKTHIKIGLGSDQGVQVGMKGWLVSESGHRIVSFEILDVVNGRLSAAFIEASLDQIHDAGGTVVLNPSS